MCGIVGVWAPFTSSVKPNACALAFGGLQRMEYRGYDSWGIGSVREGKLHITRKVGKLPRIVPHFPHSSVSIGHTRWATHGKVTVRNAHPHYSNDRRIAVVHNGIIENYSPLRAFLEKKGFRFYSQTDTEVIPNLIEWIMRHEKKPFPAATREALRKVEGHYAILAIHAHSSQLVGARNGSPLVVGVGSDNFFMASDVMAFAGQASKAIYLEDQDLITISDKGIGIEDIHSGKKIIRESQLMNVSADHVHKGKHEHFMLKEILEQPQTLRLASRQPEEKTRKIVRWLKSAKKIFLVGCGSSFHASLAGTRFFDELARLPVQAVLGSEFSAYANQVDSRSVVVAVSQSGETADTLDAVRLAKPAGARTVSIVNVLGSTLSRTTDEFLLMNAGPEICVLSTKSYAAQLSVLFMLAGSCAGKEKKCRQLLFRQAEEYEREIPKIIPSLRRLAKKLRAHAHLFIIGRENAVSSALEGALKIREVSYIHAEGLAGGELKHGSIALIEEGTPLIALCTDSSTTRARIRSNAAEVRARGGYIIGMDSKNAPEWDYWVPVRLRKGLEPFAFLPVLQLLAYYLALERECDPDRPRNLAKSVTVR
ncbi:MAG: glutamine--fructose-6-phosphate transaminase (isomerizing) [Candidatus Diapherotrites archaeon]|nr:glutamine--fructose-6-phosphate transaminase (isomerizing) [Candidatus Diapherotrites archaeon]